MGERCEIPCFSLPCANGGTCISVNSSLYTFTCPAGFTGPTCTIQLTSDPNYTVQLTQDPSDPCCNLTMLIQNQAIFSLVTVAVSSSATVFVLIELSDILYLWIHLWL